MTTRAAVAKSCEHTGRKGLIHQTLELVCLRCGATSKNGEKWKPAVVLRASSARAGSK